MTAYEACIDALERRELRRLAAGLLVTAILLAATAAGLARAASDIAGACSTAIAMVAGLCVLGALATVADTVAGQLTRSSARIDRQSLRSTSSRRRPRKAAE